MCKTLLFLRLFDYSSCKYLNFPFYLQHYLHYPTLFTIPYFLYHTLILLYIVHCSQYSTVYNSTLSLYRLHYHSTVYTIHNTLPASLPTIPTTLDTGITHISLQTHVFLCCISHGALKNIIPLLK